MSTNIQTSKEEVNKNIIELFGLDKLPEDKQKQAVNKIGGMVFQLVLVRVLPMMSEEDVVEYEKLIEKDIEPDELLDFFFDRVPGFLNIITEETESFRRDAEQVLSQTIKEE